MSAARRSFPPARLRDALLAAGFQKVATCINPGCAAVRSGKSRAAVIAATCREKFGTAGIQYQDITDNQTPAGFII